MAFIDFSETAMPILHRPTRDPALLPCVFTIVDDEAAEFSADEWRILALARDDGLETLRPQRKRTRLGRLVFGPTPPSRALANERLEALRRLAVEARHMGWCVSVNAIRAARKAGFTTTQIGRVIDSVRRVRAPVRRASA
jgi:hypothetical protein